ncbi:hypothetical protein QR680_011676 [Steinernema hermaphroditum]|uniref:RING-type domain-containing protein n=1 Tax=Steinernema hermaphroditum TaxID=289476 RepID=A0AA39LYH2_9BILA|nr:hypothetical protein QR680_011676 [Steinernema hermaphroditum]
MLGMETALNKLLEKCKVDTKGKSDYLCTSINDQIGNQQHFMCTKMRRHYFWKILGYWKEINAVFYGESKLSDRNAEPTGEVGNKVVQRDLKKFEFPATDGTMTTMYIQLPERLPTQTANAEILFGMNTNLADMPVRMANIMKRHMLVNLIHKPVMVCGKMAPQFVVNVYAWTNNAWLQRFKSAKKDKNNKITIEEEQIYPVSKDHSKFSATGPCKNCGMLICNHDLNRHVTQMYRSGTATCKENADLNRNIRCSAIPGPVYKVNKPDFFFELLPVGSSDTVPDPADSSENRFVVDIVYEALFSDCGHNDDLKETIKGALAGNLPNVEAPSKQVDAAEVLSSTDDYSNMHLEKLNIPIPNRPFVVKNNRRYSCEVTDPFIINMYDLESGESKSFSVVGEDVNLLDSKRFGMLAIADEKMFVLHVGGRSDGVILELDVDLKGEQVISKRSIRLIHRGWHEVSCSLLIAKDVVFSLQNGQEYHIPSTDVYRSSAPFHYQDSLYRFVTKTHEGGWTHIEKISQDGKGHPETRELHPLNSVVASAKLTHLRTFVFGKVAVLIHYNDSHCERCAKILRVNLETNTIVDVTDRITNINCLRVLQGWAIVSDGNAIYIQDSDSIFEIDYLRSKSVWKLEVDDLLESYDKRLEALRVAEAELEAGEECLHRVKLELLPKGVRDGFVCPVCRDIMEHPKVFQTCGHSICQKCEVLLRESEAERCPVCRKNTSSEELPPNWSLKNVLDLIIEEAVKSSKCSFCHKSISLRDDKRFYCSSSTQECNGKVQFSCSSCYIGDRRKRCYVEVDFDDGQLECSVRHTVKSLKF